MPSSRRAAADGASQDWAAGPLVWIHAADAEQIAALIQLGLRAQALRPDLRVLLTAAEAGDLPEKLPAGMRSEVLGDDQTGQVRAFLSRWQPRLCVWQFGHLRPTLLNAARSVGLPMLLIDADELGFQEHRLPWRRRSD
ncbi:MAG: glycosyltransferase N-terminal domain-containing protein, partial [Pseudomonadota bacterium]|nr:glycosyltransferase N-terminal domain-containing protein [Pseudomonadota bacterium]